LKRQRLTYAQIFDRYRRDHADWFPWTADDPEYEQKREEAIDAIKKTVRRLNQKLAKALERSEGTISE